MAMWNPMYNYTHRALKFHARYSRPRYKPHVGHSFCFNKSYTMHGYGDNRSCSWINDWFVSILAFFRALWMPTHLTVSEEVTFLLGLSLSALACKTASFSLTFTLSWATEVRRLSRSATLAYMSMHAGETLNHVALILKLNNSDLMLLKEVQYCSHIVPMDKLGQAIILTL